MLHIPIYLKNNSVYLVKVPEFASESPIAFYDEIILELNNKLIAAQEQAEAAKRGGMAGKTGATNTPLDEIALFNRILAALCNCPIEYHEREYLKRSINAVVAQHRQR